jgi:hypothetical protein
MAILTIVLSVIAIFIGVGFLLVVAMYVETRRKVFPNDSSTAQSSAPSQRRRKLSLTSHKTTGLFSPNPEPRPQ